MNIAKIKNIIVNANSITTVYRERLMLTRYSCIDKERRIKLYNPWIISGLLYGYTDRFNIKSISIEDILHMEV